MSLVLIAKLGTIKDRKGHSRKYAFFLCSYCWRLIKRRVDTIGTSCGCNTKELLSEAFSGKNNPMYGVVSPMYGKKHTEDSIQKQSDSKKGNKNPMYGKDFTIEHRKNLSDSHKGILLGRVYSQEHRENLSKAHIGIQSGENHPNWQDGKSFEIYPQEFKQIRKFIYERDNYTCQFPGCKTENPKRLDCHHIDYDKQNNDPENLITLCISCHMKTNYNRQYWIEFYNNLINERMMQNALDTRR